MFASKLPIRLPRRITAYFLLFSVGALVWLSVGAVYIARSVSDNRSESASLRWLGRGSEQIVLAYLRDKEADLQPVLAELCAQSGASYSAIVSPTGEYTAHSSSGFVGQPAAERGAASDRWGEVVRVQMHDDQGVAIHEYHAPLMAGNDNLGTLRIGIAQPSVWNYVGAGGQLAPLAFLGPACCMAAGAVLINRLVRPVADIEQQLMQVATSPSVEGCELREVPAAGAAAVGWNRVVKQRLSAPQSETLRERVRQSLDSGRDGRLDAVLNSIPDGVATTDSEGRLTYTNLPVTVIIGLKDVVGLAGEGESAQPAPRMIEQLAQHWPLSDSDALVAEENRDRPVITELAREENGQRRMLRVARHPICPAGSSQQESHVWLVRDVTQQKLAEEMRDQFVDTATHELRTPLANIKAYAETLALADVIDIEQQKQFLNTINSEATRLARFVDDLLSVSSMELGSLSLNKQVTDLGRLLTEVLTKIRPQVAEKELELEVVLPEKLPEPELDKDKIATVLVNLLGNAVKYTPEGGRIAFRVNITDQNIEIGVEDTGVGIAADEVGKVFEKFFRSSDPRVQAETGTGLGLALAQEVARLHGGCITVESEINKGSTFTVTLPLA
jgi:signal transduction histidine kinase